MKNTSIKKNIVYNTIYQILTLIIPLITAPYISRVIGASGVGTYSYTLSIQTYFSLFAALGTVTYGTREIARNRNDKYQRSKIFWEIELLTVFTSMICLIIWILFISHIEDYKIYFVILTLNLFNTMFDISWFFGGLEQFKYTIIQNSIFKILGVFLIFLLVKSPNDLIMYISIMSITTLLGTMTMWMYLPKFLVKINAKELKIIRHFKETWIYFVPTIATSIYNVLDKTLLGLITKDQNENGYYEQATKIINMMCTLTFTSLNMVLGSRISYLFTQDNKDEIKEKINISMNYILFMGVGICFGLLAVSDKFVPLFFGDGYEKTIILIKMLSPIIVIIGISNCLGSQYYNPAGLRAKSAKFIIVGSIINLILNIILIPHFKSYGATVATIIAETTISVLYLKNCNKYFLFSRLVSISWKKIVAGISMFIGIYFINYIKINSCILIFAQVIIGIFIYISCLTVLKDSFWIELYNNQLKPIVIKYINERSKKNEGI